MIRKSIKVITTSLLLSSLLSFSSLAAWEQSEQGWKYKDDTTNAYISSTWIESAAEKGLWYYVDADGIMVTNTMIDNQYYVNDKGEWREPLGSSSSNQSNTQETINDFPVESGDFQFDDTDPSHWGTEGGTGSSEADWNFLHNR